MKKKILLFSTTLGIAYLGITGYNDGPAKVGLNRTGAGRTVASCSSGGCHTAAATPASGAIVMKDKTSSVLVTDGKYTPLKTYVVTLACTATTGGLPSFGFQAAVTTVDNNSAGTLSSTAPNTVVRTVSGIRIVEHTTPIASVATGIYTVDFEWTAPAKGSGTVTFYGIANAVNMNGSTSGDQPTNGFTTLFNEDIPAGISADPKISALKLFPNPCTNILHIEGAGNRSKTLLFSISDLMGRQILHGATENSIDVSSLDQGVYSLRIIDGTTHQTSTFIKNK